MEKKLRLRYEVPGIALASWAPTRDPIVLPLCCDKLALNGTMSLSLDRETADYDLFKDDDGVWHEMPLAGNQVTVAIDAQCGDDIADEEFLTAIQEITGEYVNRLLLIRQSDRLLTGWFEVQVLAEEPIRQLWSEWVA